MNIQLSVFELFNLEVQLYMAVAWKIISYDIKGVMHDDEIVQINMMNDHALFISIKIIIKTNHNQIYHNQIFSSASLSIYKLRPNH